MSEGLEEIARSKQQMGIRQSMHERSATGIKQLSGEIQDNKAGNQSTYGSPTKSCLKQKIISTILYKIYPQNCYLKAEEQSISVVIDKQKRKIPLYLINNLFTISCIKQGEMRSLFFLYLTEQSQKIKVRKITIVETFLAEKLISYFFNEHDIRIKLNAHYFYLKIEKYAHLLVTEFGISDWGLLRNCVRGALQRMNCLDLFSDRQLYLDLKKKKLKINVKKDDFGFITESYQRFTKFSRQKSIDFLEDLNNESENEIERLVKSEVQQLDQLKFDELMKNKYPSVFENLQGQNSERSNNDWDGKSWYYQRDFTQLTYFETKKKKLEVSKAKKKENLERRKLKRSGIVNMEGKIEPKYLQFELILRKDKIEGKLQNERYEWSSGIQQEEKYFFEDEIKADLIVEEIKKALYAYSEGNRDCGKVEIEEQIMRVLDKIGLSCSLRGQICKIWLSRILLDN